MSRIIIGFAMLLTIFSCEGLLVEENDGNNGGLGNAPENLKCKYKNDLVLSNHNTDGIDYVVDCKLTFYEAVTLTIEPGTSILFKDGSGLEINSNSKISAVGTSSEPIIFKGENSGVALWRGIYINSSKNNVLDYVIIEDAGFGASYGVLNYNHGAITVSNNLNFTNCSIINSASNGVITLENSNKANFIKFENNTISGCKEFPIKVRQDHLETMNLTSCNFVKNGINMVGLHQDNSKFLETETTLKALDIPYYIEKGFELKKPLTIEAGVEIIMGGASYLGTYWNNSNYLSIQGSQSNHVTIRGKESLAGFWQGILVRSSSVQNVWEYLDLSDGASGTLGSSSGQANIVVEGDGRLTVNNCTSSRSGSDCDVDINKYTGQPIFINNSPQIVKICD